MSQHHTSQDLPPRCFAALPVRRQHDRRRVATVTLALVAMLTPGLVTSAADAPAGNPAPVPELRHPEVDTETTCIECHQEITPEVVDHWYSSAHGTNNVKCFVCHSSTGPGFIARPEPSRCTGCHADQVDHLSAMPSAMPTALAHDGGAPVPCTACHPAHLLSPHRRLVARPQEEPDGGRNAPDDGDDGNDSDDVAEAYDGDAHTGGQR